MDLNFFQKFSGWYFTAYASAYAHNDFLRIFAAYGILGFFIYVLIILALLFEIIKTNAVAVLKKRASVFCLLFIIFNNNCSNRIFFFYNTNILVYCLLNKVK